MSNRNDSTSTGDDKSLSLHFLEFCAKVRNNDPSILPEIGRPFKIRPLSEKEDIELANALMQNNNVTYLALSTDSYTKVSAEAMAKYVRTSIRLQRIQWDRDSYGDDRELQLHEEILCCFLYAIQESASLKELDIYYFPLIGGPSNLALENMLTHTQSLRSLTLRIFPRLNAVAAAWSGLKKNTTLRELTLECKWGATTISSVLTSLRDHPHLRRLCLRGDVGDLT